MKRLIFILIMLLPITTKANEKIYTDYILTESKSLEYKEETEYLKREEMTLYNTYTLEIIDEGYQIPNNTNKHLHKDENDYIEETYYTETKIAEEQIQYSYTKVLQNYIVYEIIIQDITQQGAIDDKIEYLKVYDKDTLILDINRIDTSQEKYCDSKLYKIPKTNILDIKVEIKYKDNTKHTDFEGFILFHGSNLSVKNTFKFNKTKMNNIVIQQYLLEEEYNNLAKQITWDHYTPWNYKSLVGYLKKDTKYHYYSYNKEYLNNYTNTESSDFNIDYKDSKTFYNYYQRYYYILSDKININKLNDIILDTNTNKENISITYKENNDNYIVEIEYQNTKVYKIYKKEPKLTTTKKTTPKQSKPTLVNLSSNIPTIQQKEQPQIKEPKKRNYTYMISIIPISIILYIIYYHKKK